MTNDEIKQSLEQMKEAIAAIEKELDISLNIEPPKAEPTGSNVGAPDEWGRVKLPQVDAYLASKGQKYDVWFFTTLALGQPLTDKQRENICGNVPCTPDGKLIPAGPGRYENGVKVTSFCKQFQLKKPQYMPWMSERWTMTNDPFLDKSTVATLCATVDEIIAEYKKLLEK